MDLDAFKAELAAISEAEHLKLLDESAKSQEELGKISRMSGKSLLQNGPAVNIAMEGRDGISLAITNLGMPPHELAIGFGESKSPHEARELAERIVVRLEKNWTVERVEGGRGAKGMTKCQYSKSDSISRG